MAQEVAFHSKYPELHVCLIPGTEMFVNGRTIKDPGVYVQFAAHRLVVNATLARSVMKTQEELIELMKTHPAFNPEGRVDEVRCFCMVGAQKEVLAAKAPAKPLLACTRVGCDAKMVDEDALAVHLVSHERQDAAAEAQRAQVAPVAEGARKKTRKSAKPD